MEINYSVGRYSERDKIIKVTCLDEAITLDDVFKLVKEFALNELRRVDNRGTLKEDIIKGTAPFLFRDEIDKAIQEAIDLESK